VLTVVIEDDIEFIFVTRLKNF